MSIVPAVTETTVGGGSLATGRGEQYLPMPRKAEDGNVLMHAVQTILVDPQTLYQLWRNVSVMPLWQEFVVSVTPASERMSHWVMGNPEDADGKRFEFDSEIYEDVPGHKISWRSVTKGVDQQGTVTFVAGMRGTRVTLLQDLKVPGGWLGSHLAGVAARSPEQVVKENLRHFKELAETGEIPSVAGQPHGPRSVSGGIKEWMYGETNPTPPGTSEAA